MIREALAIVSMQGNQVLNGLTTNQYEVIIKLLECAILSTDLGLYFKYVMLFCCTSISYVPRHRSPAFIVLAELVMLEAMVVGI